MTASSAPPEDADREWSAHFISKLGIEMWHDGDVTAGRAQLLPEMWAPGTTVPRLGVLATMVDVVAGSRPTGPINPTVDLRVSLLSMPPSEGTVLLECRPLKVGRRLFVGETLLCAEHLDRVFARSTVTFLNQPIAGVDPDYGTLRGASPTPESFDELLGARLGAPGTVEMDAHPRVSNGPGGTIQGGAQALLGEIAAEHALAPRGAYFTTDLEIRFLNRVRSESVVATAEILAGDTGTGDVAVRVPLTEAMDDGRVVSMVATVCRRR